MWSRRMKTWVENVMENLRVGCMWWGTGGGRKRKLARLKIPSNTDGAALNRFPLPEMQFHQSRKHLFNRRRAGSEWNAITPCSSRELPLARSEQCVRCSYRGPTTLITNCFHILSNHLLSLITALLQHIKCRQRLNKKQLSWLDWHKTLFFINMCAWHQCTMRFLL